jgi:quercetin dioxygenase-like cupin family protein
MAPESVAKRRTPMKQYAYLLVGIVLGSLLTRGAGATPPPTTEVQDPVKQSPQLYTVLLENDEVRVLEYRLKPGEKEPVHSHPAGVVYSFGDSTIRSTLPDGKTTETTGKAGSVFWRTPVTHAIENVGETEAHALAVEIKRRS